MLTLVGWRSLNHGREENLPAAPTTATHTWWWASWGLGDNMLGRSAKEVLVHNGHHAGRHAWVDCQEGAVI